MVYPALLPLMHTPRLPIVAWTDVSRRFKRTRPFRRKTKSGFCACAITFQLASTNQRCITSQKGADFIYTAGEGWILARQTRRRDRLITTPLRCDMTNALVMEHPVIDYVVHFPSHLIPLPLHPQCVFISLAAFSSNSGSTSFSLSMPLNFIPPSELYMIFCQTGLGQGPW